MASNSNALKIVIEQTEGSGVLSRLTLEYPELENDIANQIQLAYIESLLASARKLAEGKAAAQNFI